MIEKGSVILDLSYYNELLLEHLSFEKLRESVVERNSEGDVIGYCSTQKCDYIEIDKAALMKLLDINVRDIRFIAKK